MTYHFRCRPYHIGSAMPLAENHLHQLCAHLELPEQPANGILSGRTGVKKIDLQGIGKLVVKQYCRGGLLRRINRRTYLYTGKYRSQAEFETLHQVREIGVQAPEPVAFAVRGGILYHAWLVTKELPNVRALSEVSLSAPGSARAVMPAVINQIRILIRHGIYHVDLHPGNVLVDENNRVYFIDFDKARTSTRSLRKLEHRYAERWARAAKKYGLPAFVGKTVQADLLEVTDNSGK